MSVAPPTSVLPYAVVTKQPHTSSAAVANAASTDSGADADRQQRVDGPRLPSLLAHQAAQQDGREADVVHARAFDAEVFDDHPQLVDRDRVEAEIRSDQRVRAHLRGVEAEVLGDELGEVVDRHRPVRHPRILRANASDASISSGLSNHVSDQS